MSPDDVDTDNKGPDDKGPDDVEDQGLEDFDLEMMSLEDFVKLDAKRVAKNRKVDWDDVLTELIRIGKPFTTTALKAIARKHSLRGNQDINFHYSELTRILARWERNVDIAFQRRVRKDGRVFYYVTRGAE